MEHQDLWDHLESLFSPHITPMFREAVCEVGSLPALKTWRPIFKHGFEALRIVEWGIPLVLTKRLSDEFTHLKPLRQKIGSAIAKNGAPISSDLAEMDIAALMVLNKARSLKRVKVASSPRPDFHAQWDDLVVEIEVTKALPRETHVELDNFAQELMQKIMTLKLPWRIVVYFANKQTEEGTQMLLQTLQGMQPGHYKESSGKWWLFVEEPPLPVPVTEFNMTIDPNVGNHLIEGWPSGTAIAGATAGIRIYNPEEDMITVSVIDVVPGVPMVNYINPLDRKATRIQGSKISPFIIAVDIGNLPGGYIGYQRFLPLYLKEYPSISAVLLFHRDAQTNKFGWIWELHLNSYADYLLPSAMLDAFPIKGSYYWPYINEKL